MQMILATERAQGNQQPERRRASLSLTSRVEMLPALAYWDQTTAVMSCCIDIIL